MTHTTKARKLAKEILEKHAKLNSWREVAKDYEGKINFATLSRFARSSGKWIPQSGYLRDLLGLTDTCPRCHRKTAKPRRTCDPASPCRNCAALKEFRARRKCQTG